MKKKQSSEQKYPQVGGYWTELHGQKVFVKVYRKQTELDFLLDELEKEMEEQNEFKQNRSNK